MAANSIYFVGVGRLSDRVIVARHSYKGTTDLQKVKTALRQISNMQPGTVYDFQAGENAWFLRGGMNKIYREPTTCISKFDTILEQMIWEEYIF